MKKHFKASFIDHTNEEFIENTFVCYIASILLLATIILDQAVINGFTVILMIIICIILYKLGYRLGSKLQK